MGYFLNQFIINENKLNPKNPNTILSRKVLQKYFETFPYPFTRHHIDSFDQFLTQDLPAVIKANNPILRSLAVNSRPDDFPIKSLITANNNKAKAK
jgi:hypothetical protein